LRINLWVLGSAAIFLEILGIALMVFVVTKVVAVIFYFAGFTLVMITAYLLGRNNEGIRRYSRFLHYSFATLITSLVIYIMIPLLSPRLDWVAIRLYLVLALFIFPILYGLGYISLFMATELGLETFIFGVIYCLLGIINPFLFMNMFYVFGAQDLMFFLLIFAVVLKLMESHIFKRISSGYKVIMNPSYILKAVFAAILVCILVLSSVFMTNSSVFAGSFRGDGLHIETPGYGHHDTYLLYFGTSDYDLLLRCARRNSFPYGSSYISLRLNSPITIMILKGNYKPVFGGTIYYFGEAISQNIVTIHYHLELIVQPDEAQIHYLVFVNRQSSTSETSYLLGEGDLEKPLSLPINLESGKYAVKAYLLTKGDKLCSLELRIPNNTITITPEKTLLIWHTEINETHPAYLMINPVNAENLGSGGHYMRAELFLIFYKLDPEPLNGLLIIHYSSTRTPLIPVDGGIILDAGL